MGLLALAPLAFLAKENSDTGSGLDWIGIDFCSFLHSCLYNSIYIIGL